MGREAGHLVATSNWPPAADDAFPMNVYILDSGL